MKHILIERIYSKADITKFVMAGTLEECEAELGSLLEAAQADPETKVAEIKEQPSWHWVEDAEDENGGHYEDTDVGNKVLKIVGKNGIRKKYIIRELIK